MLTAISRGVVPSLSIARPAIPPSVNIATINVSSFVIHPLSETISAPHHGPHGTPFIPAQKDGLTTHSMYAKLKGHRGVSVTLNSECLSFPCTLQSIHIVQVQNLSGRVIFTNSRRFGDRAGLRGLFLVFSGIPLRDYRRANAAVYNEITSSFTDFLWLSDGILCVRVMGGVSGTLVYRRGLDENYRYYRRACLIIIAQRYRIFFLSVLQRF